ncbi:MAG: bacteriohemerythrin [Desulfobacteraceae bacterium]|jgi:hemerythrin
MDVDGVKNIVFRRVPGVDYSLIRNDIKMFNIFLSIDGIRSVSDISREDAYDVDYLFPVMDKMEKMGLLVPVGGADSPEPEVHSSEVFCNLPKEFMTGIEAVDNQHQRLVDMVTQLDDVRKTSFQTNELRQEAVGRIVIEMIDYTISHFAFEESLMEDAQYKFFAAHKRIHELLIVRAGEYKDRFTAGEDIVDELYEVLHRWLFNHIRNDDRAFAPTVIDRIKELDKSNSGWLSILLKRFFK